MASQHSPDCHHATSRNSVTIDCFHGVLGARGHVTARRQEHRRDRPLVSSKHEQRDGFGNLAHPILNSTVIPRFSTPLSFRSEDTRNLGSCSLGEKPISLALLGITNLTTCPVFPATFELLQKRG